MLRFLTVWMLSLGAASAAWAAEDVPFVTTPDHVTMKMLELAGVGEKDHVIDLGSGDGRIVITAARRFGARGLGVEIVPDLVAKSRDNAARAGVSARVRFEEQDLFKTDLREATVITMYLLPQVNLQLRPRLLELKAGTRIVSHDWDLGDWRPDRTVTVNVPDKAVGREKFSRLHRWVVPAKVQGRWCASDGSSLVFMQRHQFVDASLERGADDSAWSGRLDGAVLRLVGPGRAAVQGYVDGALLLMPASERSLPRSWRRVDGEGPCPKRGR